MSTPYSVDCPQCGAQRGKLCVATNGRNVGQHHERFVAWKDWKND